MKSSALIFGYNEYARQIASQIQREYERLHIYTLDEAGCQKAKEHGYSASIFDLGDEWDEIEKHCTIEDVVTFCTLEDDANNIFLTISLRATFEKMYIVALAKTNEEVNKLKIAGANKVLPIVQMTANLISEMLEKPVVTNVLHNILYEESSIKIAQINIEEGDTIIGLNSRDIAFKEMYNLLLLAVVDKEMDTNFIFTAKGYNHKIDPDDVLVVIGLQHDIDNFKMQVKGNR
jgi:Trk K+ transport system NAD-binding subunit